MSARLLRPSLAAAMALSAACSSDLSVTEKANCDGALQAEENVVDAPFDADGDGFFDGNNPDCLLTYAADRLDCDDRDPEVHPGAEEVPCNGADDDCDPATEDIIDLDGDGFDSCEDCLDTDRLVNPAAIERVCNSLDDDCDPYSPDEVDIDADGYGNCSDCDDNTAQRSPGNVELDCNDIDDDCDPATLDGEDLDLDGVSACTDCNDTDANVRPGLSELCDDGVDNNCNGEIDEACELDRTGVYFLDVPTRYSCTFGLVSVNVSSFRVTDAYPTLTVASGTQPGTMVGNYSTATAFSVSNFLGGTCDEEYILVGDFDSDDSFAGTLTATFTENFAGACYDCTDQRWSVTGRR